MIEIPFGYTKNFEDWDAKMQANNEALEQLHRQPIRSARHLAKDKHSYATFPSVTVNDDFYVMATNRFISEEAVIEYLDKCFVVMNIYITKEWNTDMWWVRSAGRPYNNWLKKEETNEH